MKKKNQEIIDKIHRSMLLIIDRLYRTVSYIPATVICGTLPLKYEITIRAATYEAVKGKNVGTLILRKEKINCEDIRTYKAKMYEEAMKQWQKDWIESTKGEWTEELLKEALIHNKICDFYISQGLSGHGTFGSYLKKMKRREDEMCMCGTSIESSAHIFKECERHTSGGPVTLNGHEEETLNYLKRTVEKLWKEETQRKFH